MFDIGANPSAKESKEQLEEGSEQVNTLLIFKKLFMIRNSYRTYLKDYLKRLFHHVRILKSGFRFERMAKEN